MREVSLEDRGRFLLEYIDLLLNEGVNEAAGFRHVAIGAGTRRAAPDSFGCGIAARRESRVRSRRRKVRPRVRNQRIIWSQSRNARRRQRAARGGW